MTLESFLVVHDKLNAMGSEFRRDLDTALDGGTMIDAQGTARVCRFLQLLEDTGIHGAEWRARKIMDNAKKPEAA